MHSPWSYESLPQVWLSPYGFSTDVTGFQKIFPMRQIHFWEDGSILRLEKKKKKKAHYKVRHSNTCQGTSGTTDFIFMPLQAGILGRTFSLNQFCSIYSSDFYSYYSSWKTALESHLCLDELNFNQLYPVVLRSHCSSQLDIELIHI